MSATAAEHPPTAVQRCLGLAAAAAGSADPEGQMLRCYHLGAKAQFCLFFYFLSLIPDL